MWSQEKLKHHLEAAKILNEVKDCAFEFILKNNSCTEWDVQQFIIQQFKKAEIATDSGPIVAFGKNTSYVHYFPSQYSKKLEKNSMILIDLWGCIKKKNAPFADITWMGFYGTPSQKQLEVFNLVIKARNKGISFVKKSIEKGIFPTGQEVDSAVRKVIETAGYGKKFIHSTGHSLGTTSPHGTLGRIGPKNKSKIKEGIAYTIEPGIYLNENFGVRSEIDFIVKRKKLFLTTKCQKQLIML